MISKEDVKRIAKLARLGLTQEEILKFQKDLSSILDYIEKLKEVDVSKVKPTAYSIEMENVMRKDESNEKLKIKFKEHRSSLASAKASANEKLLDLAPEIKNGYLKVKSIL